MVAAVLAKPARVVLTEVRCPDCNKLLLRANLVKGSVIEPFCEKCKARRLIVAA